MDHRGTDWLYLTGSKSEARDWLCLDERSSIRMFDWLVILLQLSTHDEQLFYFLVIGYKLE